MRCPRPRMQRRSWLRWQMPGSKRARSTIPIARHASDHAGIALLLGAIPRPALVAAEDGGAICGAGAGLEADDVSRVVLRPSRAARRRYGEVAFPAHRVAHDRRDRVEPVRRDPRDVVLDAEPARDGGARA